MKPFRPFGLSSRCSSQRWVRRAPIGARLRRSVLVGVGVAAISLALASGALANTTIGNSPPWTSGVSSGFGVSGAPAYRIPNYGQTVTVPATDTVLDSFTFYVDLPTNLIFRGEVYAWNPIESGQTSTTSYGSGYSPHAITFNTGGIPLTAGTQYVLFITTSRDYAANVAAGITATGFVGYTPTDTYSGGDWVYMDDGGNPNLWTTLGWWHPALFFPGQDDLAFTATFSPPQPCTPANFRWHYSANGSAGSWSGTKTQGCGTSFSMGLQDMEGDQKLAPGTVMNVGYDFTAPGNKASLFHTVSNAQVVFTVACVSGATPSESTFTVTMPTQTYSVTNSDWYPSGDQHSPLVYQGSAPVPDLCNGGLVRFQKGGTFSATLS